MKLSHCPFYPYLASLKSVLFFLIQFQSVQAGGGAGERLLSGLYAKPNLELNPMTMRSEFEPKTKSQMLGLCCQPGTPEYQAGPCAEHGA